MTLKGLTKEGRWKGEGWLILSFTPNPLKNKELQKGEEWLILATSPATALFSRSYKGGEGKIPKNKLFLFLYAIYIYALNTFLSSFFYFIENHPSSFKLLENQGLKGEGYIFYILHLCFTFSLSSLKSMS